MVGATGMEINGRVGVGLEMTSISRSTEEVTHSSRPSGQEVNARKRVREGFILKIHPAVYF